MICLYSMVTGAGWLMAKGKLLPKILRARSLMFISSAATVSLRYATVRRQGEKDASGLERQIISYPSVYIRLLPILSHAYVFIRLGKTLV